MADPTTMSLDSERGARLSQAAAKIQKDRQRIRRNTPAVSFSAEVFTPGLVYKDGHECADNLRVAYWKDEAKMMPATTWPAGQAGEPGWVMPVRNTPCLWTWCSATKFDHGKK